MWLALVMHKSPLVLGREVPAMELQETKKMCIKQHGSSPGSKTGLSTA